MLIEKILLEAVKAQASDIHITVGMSPILRINGVLHFLQSFERMTPEDTEDIIAAITKPIEKERLDDLGEMDFSYSFKGVGRFRVNIYRQRGSYALALRAVPLTVPTIDAMHLPTVLKDFAEQKKGLVIITGPTSSGKSTTLAAMIDHINKVRHSHVITLEDPIEYLHKHQNSVINQREIGNDSKSYSSALRSAIRQDPDVILIGEMKDLESFSIAMMAAETGHLVLSTMHIAGAVNTIDRLIDSFPSDQQSLVRAQLASVLVGVVSQQLVNRVDDSGQIGAFEILISNAAIRSHIQEGKTHQISNSIQTGKRQGMMTMDMALNDLFQQGHITKEEALSYAVEKESLIKMLG
jgi:twitching motility protein PilT